MGLQYVIEKLTLYYNKEEDFKKPMVFTPEQLYKMAVEYIEEDHVDGRENEENNIDL
jgi:hypothetical protein